MKRDLNERSLKVASVNFNEDVVASGGWAIVAAKFSPAVGEFNGKKQFIFAGTADEWAQGRKLIF